VRTSSRSPPRCRSATTCVLKQSMPVIIEE
jgi:hypothetical protein